MTDVEGMVFGQRKQPVRCGWWGVSEDKKVAGQIVHGLRGCCKDLGFQPE